MRLLVAVAFLPLAISIALAAPPADVGAAPAQPPPGQCMYVQAGVKVCTALPTGEGAFDVYAFVPAVLYVRTQDPIVRFIQPDPRYFQSELQGNAVAIVPSQEHLPDRASAIVSTQSLTITINIHRGSRQKADTQLLLLDPLRSQRTQQVARAVEEERKNLEPRLLERFRQEELDALLASGAEVRPARGRTIDRNGEMIVLRAKDCVRFGTRRYLLFSVQNLSGDPFGPRNVRLAIGEKGQAHEVAAPWKIARIPIAPAEEVQGVLELPASIPRVARVAITVEETDPRRNVELAGIEIR